jgi:hypothetical protein
MKKLKQSILSTCIMLACTLLTTIAFANNDTLNTRANDNDAFFYPKAVLENKTQCTVKARIFYVSLACTQYDEITLKPKETKSPNTSRGLCLIKKIEVTFFGGKYGTSITKVTNFTPKTGSTASEFVIWEKALNEEQTEYHCGVSIK